MLLLPSFGRAAQESLKPGEFTERILLFRTIEGDLLFDGLLAHEIDRTLYVSAVDLLEILGFKTELSIDSKIFKASTLSPVIDVKISWPDFKLSLNKKNIPISCSQIIIYENELFISSEVASKALKAKFEYLPFKSEVRMGTEVDYPKLSTIKRKSKRAQLQPNVEQVVRIRVRNIAKLKDEVRTHLYFRPSDKTDADPIRKNIGSGKSAFELKAQVAVAIPIIISPRKIKKELAEANCPTYVPSL